MRGGGRPMLVAWLATCVGCAPEIDLVLWSDDSEPILGDGDEPCGHEQKVCVDVEPPRQACANVLRLHGPVEALSDNHWRLEDCGGCESCSGPMYDLTFRAPPGWGPPPAPDCVITDVHYADPEALWSCAFVAAVVWDAQTQTPPQGPLYVGSSIDPNVATRAVGFSLDAAVVEPKACAESDGCCPLEPGKYALTLDVGTETIQLAEHEVREGLPIDGRDVDLLNERSHVHDKCDRVPHIDWVLRTAQP